MLASVFFNKSMLFNYIIKKITRVNRSNSKKKGDNDNKNKKNKACKKKTTKLNSKITQC
jgi:hypothetical protein